VIEPKPQPLLLLNAHPLCGWCVANTAAVAAVFGRSLSTAVDQPTALIAC